MSQICSTFMEAPQWLSWPQLTWPACLDCTKDSWAQKDYGYFPLLPSPWLEADYSANFPGPTKHICLHAMAYHYQISSLCWLLYEAHFENSPCVADGRMTKCPERLRMEVRIETSLTPTHLFLGFLEKFANKKTLWKGFMKMLATACAGVGRAQHVRRNWNEIKVQWEG